MPSRLEVLSAKSAPELKESVYYKDMLKTKASRVAYTRRYLSARLHPKHSPKEFLKKTVKLLGLKNPSDDMFFNVFYIQMKLGFPLIPKSERSKPSGFPTSIDMKFGEYTEENLLRHNKCASLKKFFKDFYKDKRAKFAYSQKLPRSASASGRKPKDVSSTLAPLVVVPTIVSRPERRKNGALPFSVRTGDTLTPEQYRQYKAERAKARRRFKMNIVDRLKSFQREYDYIEALKIAIKMFNIPKKYWKLFVAHFDATARTESGYNPICLAGLSNRKVKGPERGMFQLFTKYYLGKGGSEGVQKSIAGRRRVPGINYDALEGIDMPRVRAEHLSVFHQTIAHVYQYLAGWRRSARDIQMEEIFDKILNAPNDAMKKQWAYMLYLRHYRGLGGSRIYRSLLSKGIMFPENSADADKYYDKYLHGKTWQGRRVNGKSEFRVVVRQTTSNRRYIGRFLKNLRELENVDIDKLFKTS